MVSPLVFKVFQDVDLSRVVLSEPSETDSSDQADIFRRLPLFQETVEKTVDDDDDTWHLDDDDDSLGFPRNGDGINVWNEANVVGLGQEGLLRLWNPLGQTPILVWRHPELLAVVAVNVVDSGVVDGSQTDLIVSIRLKITQASRD